MLRLMAHWPAQPWPAERQQRNRPGQPTSYGPHLPRLGALPPPPSGSNPAPPPHPTPPVNAKMGASGRQRLR